MKIYILVADYLNYGKLAGTGTVIATKDRKEVEKIRNKLNNSTKDVNYRILEVDLID